MNRYPVRLRASRDAPPNRWLWLVKWLLLIPHYLVLAVLWVAFVALTLIAYVSVLFTGRYPHSIFVFNVGVLRWSWRVGFYGYQVLGTDRYPPFTLAEVPDYPAGLEIDYPPRPKRWLPLVAWLLAIPQLVIVGALTTGGSWRFADQGEVTATTPGLVVIAVIIAALILAFTGRYPRGLHDLLVGVARWSVRVVAYVTLLTEVYPPFRLDQGDTEPEPVPEGPAPVAPAAGAAALPGASPTAATSVAGPVPGAPPAGGPPAASDVSVTGRVISLIAGVLLLLTSIGVIAIGSGVLVLNASRDASGYVSSRSLDVSSTTAAITAEGMEVQAGSEWVRDTAGIGDIRITASSPSGTPLFLGIAAQSDVDRWLAGTAHDELISPYGDNEPRYRRVAGAQRSVADPAEQSFWLASASGTGTVVLDWRVTTGRFAVVLANSDGSPAVSAGVRVATRIPSLAPLGIGLIAGGALLAVAAFVLIYVGAAGLGRRHASPPPTRPVPPTMGPYQPPGPPAAGPPAAGPPAAGPPAAGPPAAEPAVLTGTRPPDRG
jgi:hypothetical protein